MVASALACVGLLGYAAAALARPANRPPLTQAQLSDVVRRINLAIQFEQAALEPIADRDYKTAHVLLGESFENLFEAEGPLFGDRDTFGRVLTDLDGAKRLDVSAEVSLSRKKPEAATDEIVEALIEKVAALDHLPSPLQACAFQPDATHLNIKIGEQNQLNASGAVSLTVGTSTQVHTFVLDVSSGSLAYTTVPFTLPSTSAPTASYTVTLTTLGGQSQQATNTFSFGSGFSTDCTLGQQ